MPTYDPLAILDRASASSAQWLQQLDEASARQAEARQRAFTLGLASDLAFNTHQTTLDRTNAGNVYGARRAEADTRLLPAYETRQGALWRLDTEQAQMQGRLLPAQEAMQGSAYRLGHEQNRLALDALGRAWTPDNQRARDAAEDMRYQNPVADAAARDAAGSHADPLQAAQAAQRAAGAWPGAQGVAGQYGAPYASGLYANASSALLAGNLDTANALLRTAGLGQVAKDAAGQITYTDAQGHAYPTMPAASAAALLQTLTAQQPTPLQHYTDAATRGRTTLTPAQESQKTVLEHRIQTLDKALVSAFDDAERASLQQQRDEATRELASLFGVGRPGMAAAPTAGTLPAADALGFGAKASQAGSTGVLPATLSTASAVAAASPAPTDRAVHVYRSATDPAGPAPAKAVPAKPAPRTPASAPAAPDVQIDSATGTLKRDRKQPRTTDALETYRDAAERWRTADAALKEARQSQARYLASGQGVDRRVAVDRYAQAEAQARQALLAARDTYRRAQQEDGADRKRRTAPVPAPATTAYGITLPTYGTAPYRGPVSP
jgi:hypothetical protein